MNHGVRNDSRRNNRKRKQEGDFCFEFRIDVYLNAPHDEEARYQNKTVEGY